MLDTFIHRLLTTLSAVQEVLGKNRLLTILSAVQKVRRIVTGFPIAGCTETLPMIVCLCGLLRPPRQASSDSRQEGN